MLPINRLLTALTLYVLMAVLAHPLHATPIVAFPDFDSWIAHTNAPARVSDVLIRPPVGDVDTVLSGSNNRIEYKNSVMIGERFAGQTLTTDTGNDVLTGLPSVPLTVVAGEPGENLLSKERDRIADGVVLFGKTDPDSPNPNFFGDYGGGSIAFWFRNDLPGLIMGLVGDFVPIAKLSFYARDGSLIDVHEFEVAAPNGEVFFFAHETAQRVIAGFTLENARTNSRLGVGEGVGVDPRILFAPPVPEPSAATLMVVASTLLVLVFRRRA